MLDQQRLNEIDLLAKSISEELQRKVDNCFNNFWKDIVCDQNGNLDLEKVKRELYDYSLAQELVAEVYDELANVSKIHADPNYVIGSVYERMEGVKIVYLPERKLEEQIETAGNPPSIKTILDVRPTES